MRLTKEQEKFFSLDEAALKKEHTAIVMAQAKVCLKCPRFYRFRKVVMCYCPKFNKELEKLKKTLR